MTKKELLEFIDSWENFVFVLAELHNDPACFDLLMEIALYDQGKNSWRAAWLADRVNEKQPHLIIPYLEKLVQQLKTEKQHGKKRHFLKLISQNEIEEKNFGFLFEYCLTVLTSSKEPPANRVHAMQILYNLSEYEKDLKPEVLALIEHEMEYHSTPGILSRGKKLASKLEQQIHSR